MKKTKTDIRIENTKAALLDALEKSLGIVSTAVKYVGINRKVFYDYYNSDPEFKKAVDDINEITLDFVESQLLKNIRDGENQAIMFYMKYKGRTRGYSEKLEIEGNMSHNIQVIKLIGPQDNNGTTN